MSKKHVARFNAKQLEALAKRDITGIGVRQCYKIRKRLRKTIDIANETNRPDRAEWCEVLLKKFQTPKA